MTRILLKLFPLNIASLIGRMLIGGVIGLGAVALFLSGTGDPDPAWGKYWWIRPLIIVPLAGAMGGVFNYVISQQEFKSNWAKAAGVILSIIVFIIGLWLGTVLGLDGTYWN